MKKIVLRSLTVATLLAAALSITAWAITLLDQQPLKPEGIKQKGIKQKTLREIAQERDVEVSASERESSVEFDNLRSLSRQAAAIVVGRITEEESFFAGDYDIVTKYQVDVQRVVRDATPEVAETQRLLSNIRSEALEPPAPLTSPLTFVRSGGVVNVNGHRASMTLKGSGLLGKGKTFVLFLGWGPFKAYRLLGGASGAYLITDGRHIKPLGSEKGISNRYDGTDLESFISEVLKEK